MEVYIGIFSLLLFAFFILYAVYFLVFPNKTDIFHNKKKHPRTTPLYVGSWQDQEIVGNEPREEIDAKQKLAEARSKFDRRGEGKALNRLAGVYWRMSLGDKSDKGIDLLQKVIRLDKDALILAREMGDERLESRCLFAIGQAYRSLGDTREAVTWFEKYLEIDKRVANRPIVYTTVSRDESGVQHVTSSMTNPFQKQADVASQIRDYVEGFIHNRGYKLVPLSTQQVDSLSKEDRDLYHWLEEAQDHYGDALILNRLYMLIELNIEDPQDGLHSRRSLDRLKAFLVPPLIPYREEPSIATKNNLLLNGILTNKSFSLVVQTPEQVAALPDTDRQVYQLLLQARDHFGETEMVRRIGIQVEARLLASVDFPYSTEAWNILRKFIVSPDTE
jgi:tetratricopeptide (TPR) repeat protein